MRRPVAVALLLLAGRAAAAAPAGDTPPPTLAAKTAHLARQDGLLPIYWDARAGKLWLEIARWNAELLFVDGLASGVGSNDVGLDRGRAGEGRVVHFERSGPRVLLVQDNLAFRAGAADPAERRAVDDAFARSVLWGFEVAAEDGDRVLVDATGFFSSDQHGVAQRLKDAGQGSFGLDAARSAIDPRAIRGFPRNLEVEATLTFASDAPGAEVRAVTPDPHLVSVREHYSFVALPPPGYRPRAADPRAGFFTVDYADYSAPIGQPLVQHLLTRHRLVKKDPRAAVSDPVEPIVYYLDRGTPEPVRSALLDGARWWAAAFAAAGFSNAFRVELMPEGGDLMDVRYNVIEWVHRATRGWSYGATIVDPRTGEIIKGHVRLGSLRVRQDYLIFEGLLAPYRAGAAPDPRMLAAALARLRQLAAHEVGHTLGLEHNFIASSHARASVMDYPHPWVTLGADGAIDVSDAYATGVGAWDRLAIRYGYAELPAGADERAALDAVLAEGRAAGLVFLTDQDARGRSTFEPQAHLWDNGDNAVDELGRVLRVRARALERFGEDNVLPGAPLATLEDVLVPIYLYHRYQTDAACKSIGGVRYRYALRGDGQPAPEPVAPAEQRRALAAVLSTLAPETLTLPERVIRLIPPRPNGFGRTREDFASRTGGFDPLAAAEAAATLTVRALLDDARAARLVEQHARDAAQPSLGEVIDRTLDASFRAPRPAGLAGEVQRAVDVVVLRELMRLAVDPGTAPAARALARLKLGELRAWAQRGGGDEAERAHRRLVAAEIDRFEKAPDEALKALAPPAEPPPGEPIGDEE